MAVKTIRLKRLKKMKALIEKDYDVSDLAKHFKVSNSTIWADMREFNLRTKQQIEREQKIAEAKKLATEMIQSGTYSSSQIARETKLSLDTIDQIKRKLNGDQSDDAALDLELVKKENQLWNLALFMRTGMA